jgi:hypothetical protein
LNQTTVMLYPNEMDQALSIRLYGLI